MPLVSLFYHYDRGFRHFNVAYESYEKICALDIIATEVWMKSVRMSCKASWKLFIIINDLELTGS